MPMFTMALLATAMEDGVTIVRHSIIGSVADAEILSMEVIAQEAGPIPEEEQAVPRADTKTIVLTAQPVVQG